MEEMDGISKERDLQLRPLVRYAQEESEESLLEQFRQYLSEQDEKFNCLLERHGERVIDASLSNNCRMNELENFKSLIALARQLGPSLAYDLEQILLYEFGDDSNGILVGAGAPDLLLWTRGGENEFWFFSEVKAPGDYLRPTQKAWLTNHWRVIQGYFLLTIIA